jgi:hypothetical protein
MSNVIHSQFPSVSAMLDNMARPMSRKSNQTRFDKIMSRDRDRGSEWLGIEGTPHDVVTMINSGTGPAFDIITSMRESLSKALPRATGVGRVRVRGAMGDELDIHATMRGDHSRAWSSSPRRVRIGSTIVRLLVDVGGNAGVTADTLRWRGIAGAVLSDIISRAGYSCEIVACCAVVRSYPGAPTHTYSTVIKPMGSPLDTGLLSSTVALPGFFRVLFFNAIVRAADDAKKTVDDGLGRTVDPAPHMPVSDRVTQLLVPHSVSSEASAKKWITDTLAMLQGARG